MPEAKITSKGQITIPEKIRTQLGLSTGDKIEFRIDKKGTRVYFVPKKSSIDDLYGFLSHRKLAKPLSIQEMDAAIASRFSKKI